jgi:putative transposase
VQSIKQECLDHFLVFGLRHLDHLSREYLAYYLTERPHQAKDNEPLIKPNRRRRDKKHFVPLDEQIVPLSDVRCKQRLGGLLNSYSRKAA